MTARPTTVWVREGAETLNQLRRAPDPAEPIVHTLARPTPCWIVHAAELRVEERR